MSDNYENESFEKSSNKSDANAAHSLKLSIDLLSVRNLQAAANLVASYQLQLNELHSFQSSPPTPVNQGGADTQLQNGFASFEFLASKQQLFSILSERSLTVALTHVAQGGQQTEVGLATVPLNRILSAPLKQTPSAVVRVHDDYVDIKDPRTGASKGSLRIVLYLEDNGIRKVNSLQQAREQRSAANSASPGQGEGDYQAVWQLQMWKRAEEAKFKAYLRQREIEKIEEVTSTWKMKEQERETTFQDALKSIETLETKLRTHALDLQRREERIVQLEEELKHKINEVSRQLASKEEEVISVKKRFKEEKNILETEKKRAQVQIEDLRSRLEQADSKFVAYKQEVEHSPLNVLRTELAQKQIEIVELESKVNAANEQRDEYKQKFEKVKQDMITLKKQIDREKEQTLSRQAEELEQIKKHMRDQAQQAAEKQELGHLRAQLATLQDKLSESQRLQMQGDDDLQQAQA